MQLLRMVTHFAIDFLLQYSSTYQIYYNYEYDNKAIDVSNSRSRLYLNKIDNDGTIKENKDKGTRVVSLVYPQKRVGVNIVLMGWDGMGFAPNE